MLNVLASIVAFVVGFLLVALTFTAAVRTVVIPRSENVWLTRIVFRIMRYIFDFFTRRAKTYEDQDTIMAYYAPMSLMVLIVSWLALTTAAFTLMHWAVGVRPWLDAFWLSGSSLLTLGFRTVDTLPQIIITFADAALGLIYIALLIAYLPTIYGTFSDRELLVNMLEIRAGAPFSAAEMIKRFYRLKRMDKIGDVWIRWEEWFVEIEETHTSLPMLVFFRSPASRRHWVTAAGTVMDAAAIMWSVVDYPRDAQSAICLRAGYIALREIADFFGIQYNTNPTPDDPISVTRAEFDALCLDLEEQGVPLIDDREQAWMDFAGWRVNYDTVILALAAMTMAPYAPWISDRSISKWGEQFPGKHHP